MSPDEAAAFERDPGFADATRLRRYDDEGKRAEWSVPPLDSYPLLEAAART